jgi:CDP-diacylglycerol---glycerol-3-phosphate 3-phosphatidyltransferase
VVAQAPNALTVLRILLVPALVVALLSDAPGSDVVAALIFAAASATDWFDGWLARSRGLVSDFGKLMDPVADKLLVVGALVTLVSLDRLAAWVAVVIIARELAVTVARATAHQAHGQVHAAAWLGKLKTAVQVLAILLLVLLDPAPAWVDAVVYVAVLLTVVSGIDALRTVRAAEPAR